MEQSCHRCGAAINESDPFCPHCGAPQLRYEAPDETVPSANAPFTLRMATRNPNGISWRDAILAAAIISIPAGLLSSLLGFEALWVLAGGMAAITLYRRRTGMPPSGKMGWRIGALLGLFAAVLAAAFNGIALLVQRYGFHQGAVLDQHFRNAIEASTKMYSNVFAGSNPDMAAALSQALHFWLSPSGIAAMVLSNAVFMTALMLLFAAAGGALGARFTAKSPQHVAR